MPYTGPRTAPGKRATVTVRVRRPDEMPVSVKMFCDVTQRYQVSLPAGETKLQILNGRAMGASGNVCILVLNSTIEGVRWWKVASATPTVDTTPVLPVKELRPFEVTDDPMWATAIRPAIVLNNPTALDAIVDIFFGIQQT